MEHVRIPSNSWVAVCDGAKALTFRNEGDAELLSLQVLDVLDQPTPPTRELGTERPGRVHESQGVSRSAVEQGDLHDAAETAFLAGLAAQLDRAVREQSVRHLVLVAPARALGILRQHMTPALRAVVVAEVGKDLVHLSTPEIERHLSR